MIGRGFFGRPDPGISQENDRGSIYGVLTQLGPRIMRQAACWFRVVLRYASLGVLKKKVTGCKVGFQWAQSCPTLCRRL